MKTASEMDIIVVLWAASGRGLEAPPARSQGDFGQTERFGQKSPWERAKAILRPRGLRRLCDAHRGDFGQFGRFGQKSPWERAETLRKGPPGPTLKPQNGAILWGFPCF